MTQWSYKVKPVGRGNWKAIVLHVTSRIPIGMVIAIGNQRYRVLDIVNVSGG